MVDLQTWFTKSNKVNNMSVKMAVSQKVTLIDLLLCVFLVFVCSLFLVWLEKPL